MKPTLALVLLVFGIVGCATGGLWKGYILDSTDEVLLTRIPDNSSNPIVSKNDSIPDDYIFIRFNLLNSQDSFLEAYVSPTIFERQRYIVGGVKNSKYEYRSGDPFKGYWIQSAIKIYKICESYSSDVCVLDEFDGKKFLEEAIAFTCSGESIQRYANNPKVREKILSAPRCLPFIQEEKNEKARYVLEQNRLEEQKKLAVIYALKERCISYGFSGSDNIAACVQREAQHDYEIEQKEYELQLAKQQLLAQQNQQQVDPEMPWYLLALEALAKGIEKGYEQQALINTMDARYERKDIWRYCRPNC
jgi:hypothetical protein